MAVRVTQNAAEAVLLPTSQQVRFTQLAAEAVMNPTSEQVRFTHLAVEVVIENSNPARKGDFFTPQTGF